ncbi:hypothetical protein FIBSPDRAFT_883759 [Athelia psychrophila]|uniref:Uncharacterized protein n=1 Tax=Athelia psychrophila TaxID=1759441 RepID=A0A166TWR2_9AGAM|nr:hypothetical protein FIBSPDRAFT_883759 [Fibularhizoctonia sp. CBS 109695]
MFKLQGKLGSLQPADLLYAIPKSLAPLQDHIDQYTCSFLMYPMLLSYVGKQATNLILDMLQKNPASRWPVDIGHSKAKMDVIKSWIFVLLGKPAVGETEKETTLIELPTNSINIVALCKDLVTIYKGVFLKVTIQMCSRVVVLCDMMILSGDMKSASQSFWPAVNKELQGVQDKYPLDAKKRSRIFVKNLTNDRRLFGQADVDSLHNVNESKQEAHQLVSGSAITLFTLPDDMAAANASESEGSMAMIEKGSVWSSYISHHDGASLLWC